MNFSACHSAIRKRGNMKIYTVEFCFVEN